MKKHSIISKNFDIKDYRRRRPQNMRHEAALSGNSGILRCVQGEVSTSASVRADDVPGGEAKGARVLI
jgi:hypothetical protein